MAFQKTGKTTTIATSKDLSSQTPSQPTAQEEDKKQKVK